MSTCAPTDGVDDSDPEGLHPFLVFHNSAEKSWQSIAVLSPTEQLVDNDRPLHPGFDGVIAVFERESDE